MKKSYSVNIRQNYDCKDGGSEEKLNCLCVYKTLRIAKFSRNVE